MSVQQSSLTQLQHHDVVAHLVHIKSVSVWKLSKTDYLVIEVSDGKRTMSAFYWTPTPTEIKQCQSSTYAFIEGYIHTYYGKDDINVVKLTLSPLPYTAAEIAAWAGNPAPSAKGSAAKSCNCSMKDLLSRGCGCGGC